MAYAIPLNQVQRRLNCINLPDTVKHQYWLLIQKWVASSGEEWTVNRLKSIKQDILNSVAQDNYVLKSEWIRKSNPYSFSGIVGSLQRLAKRSSKSLKEVMALLNMHTILKANSLTASQTEKFIKAVSTSAHPSSKYYIDNIKRAAKLWSDPGRIYPSESILHRSEGKPSHEKRIFEEILRYFSTDSGQYLLMNYDDVIYPALCDALPSKRCFNDDTTIGSICVTQNPGYKARFYAAPHIWIQHVLQPLGDKIYDIVRSLPWDCTFDQSKGFPFVQEVLQNHNNCYCFDLSSATDRFPIDLQIHALRKILPHKSAQRHISLLAWLTRQPWKFLDSELTWKRGQPLGMYPSFGMFTMTHGLMLYALNGCTYNHEFFVLGDDVIILDKDLAMRYEQFLLDCNIDYNPDKTIISDKFGEFAGRLIFKDFVLPSRKWTVVKDDSLIQFLQNWGPQFSSLVPKRYQSLFERWSSLPEPYGLGFNPKGLSVDERLQDLEEFLIAEDAQLEYLVSYRSLNLKRLHFEGFRYYYRDLASIMTHSDAFDQKAFQAVAQLIPALKYHFGIAGKNLYSVDTEQELSLKHRSKTVPQTLSKVLERFGRLINR